MSCSWRFTNLNVAFRSVMGEPTQSLHVYSDVAGSSMVGNRVTDLLRKIKYKREGQGTMYFEPLHIQYLSLRNEVIEIIQTQVAETNGDLVKFGEGNTTLSRCHVALQKDIKKEERVNKINHGSETTTTTTSKTFNPTTTASTTGGRDQHSDRWDSQSRSENKQSVGKVSQKSSFKTHGRDPKGKTKTLCRRILHLQHHVSIKRKGSGEKEKKPILGDE